MPSPVISEHTPKEKSFLHKTKSIPYQNHPGSSYPGLFLKGYGLQVKEYNICISLVPIA